MPGKSDVPLKGSLEPAREPQKDRGSQKKLTRQTWSELLNDRMMRLLALPLIFLTMCIAFPTFGPGEVKVLGDHVIDPIIIGFSLFSFLRARRNTPHLEERRFWDSLSVGFAFSLVTLLLNIGWSASDHTSPTLILTDTLYLAFYLAIFVGIEGRPHRTAGWSKLDSSSRLESFGAVVFVTTLLVYAVLVPSRFNPREYESFVPPLAAYLSLDLLILGRALHFRATCTSRRWKSLYGWFAMALIFTAFNDFRELVNYSVRIPVPRGDWWDLLWYPPLVAFVGMARLALFTFEERPAAEPDDSKSRTRPLLLPQCSLVVYSFLLPVLHFIWYGAGFLDPSLRDIREWVILAGLLILATTTIGQYLSLDRQNRVLRQQLTLAEENLNQARRMEAVGRLAGGVAHDFNNLLMVIRGYAEILQDGARSDGARRATTNILGAADRAVALTRQLLAFSRKQVIAPRALDVNSVIASMETFLLRLMGGHIQLQTRMAPHLWAVRADRGQIDQVLMNLAANARDAMPQGGTCVIRTNNVELNPSDASRLGLAAPGEYVRMEFHDDGIGMNEQTRRCIFEPFFTTKETGKGTGLGLATVYAIVQHSAGAIEVQSRPGCGTQFSLYFPRTLDAVEPEPCPPIHPNAPGTETILLVEDEPSVRALAREILADSGYAVLEARSPGEALQIAGTSCGIIHLLVTDVIMPGMGGREMAEKLGIGRPQMKVLFISGHTDDAVMVHGVAGNSIAFLQKPFTRGTLLSRVRQILGPGPDPVVAAVVH